MSEQVDWQGFCRRSDYQLPEHKHYLNCAYMAPFSHAVENAGIEGVKRRRWPGSITADDFFAGSQRLRQRFGAIVGAAPETIAIIPAASYGISMLAQNLSPKRGQKIVLLAEQFPSNVYRWKRFEENGVKVQHVGPAAGANRGQSWNERLLKAIDATTAIVSIPHVHWADGTIFDLQTICDKAHKVGAKVIIDGTQSVGALEFDLAKFPVDGLIVAAYKWLMGPYGLAFAYVGDHFRDGVPLEDNWLTRKNSEDFQRLVEYEPQYAEGAIRYDMGQRSNPVILPMAEAALTTIQDLGISKIRSYCRWLMSPYWAQLTELGIRFDSEHYRAAHIFGLRLPKTADMNRVKASLAQGHVEVSYRGDAIRVSPNVYNNRRDVEALISGLKSGLA